MRKSVLLALLSAASPVPAPAANPPAFPADPEQALERTSFQTGQAWNALGNLPADVAMVYGIDPGLPERVRTWRDRGYRVHMMTGASWGEYHDDFYGRRGGKNHEDDTPSIVLCTSATAPHTVTPERAALTTSPYDAAEQLLYLRFPNEARPRVLGVEFAHE